MERKKREFMIDYIAAETNDPHKMMQMCIDDKECRICHEAHKNIYDLNNKKDFKRLIKDLIIEKDWNDKRYYDVCQAGRCKPKNNDEKIYNILKYKDLEEMKKKKYIIMNFYCDDGLIFMTEEQFKDFLKDMTEDW